VIGRLLAPAVVMLLVLPAGSGPSVASGGLEAKASGSRAKAKRVRAWTIRYRAHNGARRGATVVLPAWYGRGNNPRIPLVISPHGRGLTGWANAKIWGNLPARGRFAVVSPGGQGRRLPRHSWGYSGQIEDLARMPDILRRTMPWLRVDRRRIFAVGGSMGGQETLLLLARHPGLLAGAAVFDAVVDFTVQYRRFRHLKCNKLCRRRWVKPLGDGLRELARYEVGDMPKKRPTAYRVRSPITYVRAIATSCVPLQIWWSVADQVVTAEERQSSKLFWTIRRLNPNAPVTAYVGFWRHTVAMHARSNLPIALVGLGLLRERVQLSPPDLRTVRPHPSSTWVC
jgi:pimeloyl-ACP methyl ester carboxylesterase